MPSLGCTFDFHPVSAADVAGVIMKLKNCGKKDLISAITLKGTVDLTSPEIAKFVNASIMTGTVPEELKLARITPIHKGGNRDDETNYRPISNLPALAKIMEKCVSDQLIDYIMKNNILAECQYGFRTGSGTHAALFDLLTNVYTLRDSGNIVAVLFVDMQKAFDTMVHLLLLRKLYGYGIKGTPFDWFSSYILGRKQYVESDGVESEHMRTLAGVPQGSKLGPLLFNLYINDVKNCDWRGNVYLYADDLALVVGRRHLKDLWEDLQFNLGLLLDWAGKNKLTVNTSKTKLMLIGADADQLICPLCIDQSKPLEIVREYKYLGVLLDDKLTWEPQLLWMRRRISALSGVFGRTSSHMSDEVKRMMYHALVAPILSYGSLVWSAAGVSRLKGLQRSQNQVIKRLFSLPRLTPSKSLFEDYKFKTLHETINQERTTHITKIINNRMLSNITIGFPAHGHNVRHSNKIVIPKSNTTKYGLRSPFALAARAYNESSA
ncbi:uncharacterized protein DMENIID0001_163480 [Sergentomyia squamirostris]